ncbi:hypothetical protein C8T65DRAFT_52645 [Cerioporus squamosus]|nr:hypothetical protein C8T65DRAFT_52645 [Cerioporus squamosus]
MPPRCAAADAFDKMQSFAYYDTMMVLPEDPMQRSASRPAYLLSSCKLLPCFKTYGGMNLDVLPEARIFDFGNGVTSLPVAPCSSKLLYPNSSPSRETVRHGRHSRGLSAPRDCLRILWNGWPRSPPYGSRRHMVPWCYNNPAVYSHTGECMELTRAGHVGRGSPSCLA